MKNLNCFSMSTATEPTVLYGRAPIGVDIYYPLDERLLLETRSPEEPVIIESLCILGILTFEPITRELAVNYLGDSMLLGDSKL